MFNVQTKFFLEVFWVLTDDHYIFKNVDYNYKIHSDFEMENFNYYDFVRYF